MIEPNDVAPKTARALGGEGILTGADLAELNEGARRVAALMADGDWHDADAIRSAAGVEGAPASEGLRRLRELRAIPGVSLERKNLGDRLWAYRVTRGATVPEERTKGILDKVDLATLPGAERWSCSSCGRNGFTMNRPNASRRSEPCPDCGESMEVWPSSEKQSDRLPVLPTDPSSKTAANANASDRSDDVPEALQFLTFKPPTEDE